MPPWYLHIQGSQAVSCVSHTPRPARSSLPGPVATRRAIGVTQPPSPKSQSPVRYEVQRGAVRLAAPGTHSSSSSTFFSLLSFTLTLNSHPRSPDTPRLTFAPEYFSTLGPYLPTTILLATPQFLRNNPIQYTSAGPTLPMTQICRYQQILRPE